MGKLIVIEGLDGSGKATQSQLLCDRLGREGFPCKRISFPDYGHESAALVELYLSGGLGTAEEVGAYAASSFFAMDRYVSFRRRWGADYAGGLPLGADRYSTSNAVHQTSKLPRAQWDDYLDWLEDYEYSRLGLPRPDLVIYLSMPIEVSQKLLEQRYHGHTEKKDIHEADVEYLRRCYESAGYVSARQGWRVLQCSRGGLPLPVEEIAAQVWAIAKTIVEK